MGAIAPVLSRRKVIVVEPPANPTTVTSTPVVASFVSSIQMQPRAACGGILYRYKQL